MQKSDLCQNCINWLEHSPNIIDCDFDKFASAPIDKALTFIPELFDCEEFEDIKKLKG